MSCNGDCEKRRAAMIEDVLNMRLLSAAGHAIIGAAEMTGMVDKPSVKKAKKEKEETNDKADP